jgi:hypothetical protein
MHETKPLPKLERIGGNRWRLAEDYRYEATNGMATTIPKGFETDLTSSPFGIVIRPDGGHYWVRALAHDWFYDCLNRGRPDPIAPTRKAADVEFLRGMKADGVRPLVRFGMFIAVRALGANPIVKRMVIK